MASVLTALVAPPAPVVRPCACPACKGLPSLERPRFFAGQLLTESELNSLESYVLAKSRLHNRYLHGPGVVCGLEVVCGDCQPWVTVKQGYAIDPCGNDVVVGTDQHVDVMRYISDCLNAQRSVRPTGCDPIAPPNDPGCREGLQQWCLTLTYQEKEARPVMSLHQPAASSHGSSCGCARGCGTSGGAACTCQPTAQATCAGNGSKASAGACATYGGATPAALAPCEPTRIYEQFRIDLVPSEVSCGCSATLEDRAAPLLQCLFSDTLLWELLTCLNRLTQIVGTWVKASDWQVLWPLLSGSPSQRVTVDQLHDACCNLRQAVVTLYGSDPLQVRCAVPATLAGLTCPPAAGDLADYQKQVEPVVKQLFGLLVAYGVDCACSAIMPRCAPDPSDDRLILACLTVDTTSQQVVHVCNFHGRRFAGAFPSVSHWLSAVPVIPALKYLVEKACCSGDPFRDAGALLAYIRPDVRERSAVLGQAAGLPAAIESFLARLLTESWGSLIADAAGRAPAAQPVPPVPQAQSRPAVRRQRPGG